MTKLRITPDGCFIFAIALSLFVNATVPLWKFIPYPYSLLGILPIVVGTLLVYVTQFILMKKKTSIKPFERPAVLLTSGPFKWSRNPIYGGMTLMLLGLVTMLGSLSPFVFPFLFAVFIHRCIIPAEEQRMEKQFGQQYLNYKAAVRRWI